MSSLFAQVAELFLARQVKKASGFDELAQAVADGKAPSPTKIAEQLEEFGKTPEDLEREVTRRQQRVADAQRLATLPALHDEKAELERKAAKENARYEAVLKPLQQEHQQTIDGLNDRYRNVVAQIPAVEGLRDKLRQSYVGPLQAELAEISAKQQEIQQSISTIEATAEVHETAAEGTDLDDDRASRRAAAKGCREGAAARRKELVPLVARAAEISELVLQP
jgi:hypothetical protein